MDYRKTKERKTIDRCSKRCVRKWGFATISISYWHWMTYLHVEEKSSLAERA